MCLIYADKITYSCIKGNNAFLLPLVVNKVSCPSELGLYSNKGWESSSAEFCTPHSEISHGIKNLGTWIFGVNKCYSHPPHCNSSGISSEKSPHNCLFCTFLNWSLWHSPSDENKATCRNLTFSSIQLVKGRCLLSLSFSESRMWHSV